MDDSKIEYLKRRAKGLRGQGDVPKPTHHHKGERVTFTKHLGRKKGTEEREILNAADSHYIQIGSQLSKVNRRRARQTSIDRSFTSKGYVFGVRIGSKQHGIIKHHAELDERLRGRHQPTRELEIRREKFPTEDPTKTNHQRMLERKEARDARQEAERAKVSATVDPARG